MQRTLNEGDTVGREEQEVHDRVELGSSSREGQGAKMEPPPNLNKMPPVPPIAYTVALKIPEVVAYWDSQDRPLRTRSGKKKTIRGGVRGYKVAVGTTRYTLYAYGAPSLRHTLKEQLEALGFTGLRVVPDDTFPYTWLPTEEKQ